MAITKNKRMEKVEIYTDGGCSPNPGKGKWAFAITEDEYKKGGSESTTNNIMEMTAIIEAIGYAKHEFPNHQIIIYSDSQYCVNGFTSWMHSWQKKGWKKKKGEIMNLDLWKVLFEIKEDVVLKWVKGHNGNPMNEFVDSLVNFSNNNYEEVEEVVMKTNFKPSKAELELFDVIQRHFPYPIAGLTRNEFIEKLSNLFLIDKKRN